MRVHRPTDNPQSQGYSINHKGYDFRGNNLPDEVRSGLDGEIIERVDRYVSNWQSTPPLTTRDYGNYIKVKHTDGTFALFAHLKKGSSFVVGTKVKRGEVIARIGNTGNSTGPHLHAEYRTAANRNTPVTFEDEATPDPLQECLRLHGELVKETEELKATIGGLKGTVTKRDEEIEGLRGGLAKEKESKKALISEWQSRVDNANSRAGQIQAELDLKKKEAESRDKMIEDLKGALRRSLDTLEKEKTAHRLTREKYAQLKEGATPTGFIARLLWLIGR